MLKKPTEYEKRWWDWWDSINPATGSRKEGCVRTEGTIEWPALAKAGPNGFVNVLMLLVGLRNVATDGAWRTAVAEVTWVLRGVCSALVDDRYVFPTFVPSQSADRA